MPPIDTRPSWLTRRSSFSRASNGVAGSACSSGFSAANASATTYFFLPCTRTLAIVASQSSICPLRFVEVAEAAGEEEVLPDVAERALHLALGLGAAMLGAKIDLRRLLVGAGP